MPTYTARRPVAGDPEAYFDYVADPTHLPDYFPRMIRATRTNDGKVETVARADADQDGTDETVSAEAEFSADRSTHTIFWAARGENDYHGSLTLTRDGATLRIHTHSDFDGFQQALEDALDTIARNLQTST